MLIRGAYVQYIIHSWNKAAWFISYKNFLKVLALCSLCRLLLYSWIHFSAALVYTNCSIWLLAPHIFAKCLPSSDCSSLLRKKKKKKSRAKPKQGLANEGLRVPLAHAHILVPGLPIKTLIGQCVNGKPGQTRSTQNICSKFRCGFARRLLYLVLLALHVIHATVMQELFPKRC